MIISNKKFSVGQGRLSRQTEQSDEYWRIVKESIGVVTVHGFVC